MTKILIATHNKGKAKELTDAFKNKLPYNIVTLDDLNITEDCEETCDTFTGNALQKAKFYHELTGYPTISDDSGLEVAVLNGAPSVYSARWTGEHADDQTNRAKLVEEMKKKNAIESQARYVCAMAFVSDTQEITTVGILNGVVKTKPSGTNGFSYDPHFYYFDKSLGDMTFKEKQKISHRTKAIENLIHALKKREE